MLPFALDLSSSEKQTLKVLDEELIRFIRSPPTDEEFIEKLSKLYSFSHQDYYAYSIVHGHDFQFVESLKEYLQNIHEISPRTDRFMNIISGCFMKWSLIKPNASYLGSEELGLVPLLLKNIEEFIFARTNTFYFILNCLLEASTHSYLLSEEVGLLKYFHTLMLTRPTEDLAYWGVANITGNLTPLSLQRIIDENLPVLVWQCLLQEGPSPKVWMNRNNGRAFRCLFVLMYICGYEKGNKALVEDAKIEIDYFRQIILNGVKEGIPARIICLNYYYHNNPDYYSSLSINTVLSILDMLKVLLTDILKMAENDQQSTEQNPYAYYIHQFGYGVFRLETVIVTILNLSHLDIFYQKVVTDYRIFFDYFLHVCYEFINNEYEHSEVVHGLRQHAGGGGKDIGSIERILQFFIVYVIRSRNNKDRDYDHDKPTKESVDAEDIHLFTNRLSLEENPVEVLFQSELFTDINNKSVEYFSVEIEEEEGTERVNLMEEKEEVEKTVEEVIIPSKQDDDDDDQVLLNQILNVSREIRLLPKKDERQISSSILESCEILENLLTSKI